MLDELRPRGLYKAAAEVGLEPFEVIRVLVAGDAAPEEFRFSDADLDMLREIGGLEVWWDDAPTGDDAKKQAILGVFGKLVEKGCVGEVTTRLDNLWRGLPADLAVAVQAAVNVTLQKSLLLLTLSPKGQQVCVNPQAVDYVRQLVEGQVEPAEISALW